jgi:methionine-rich copper-binding protein CopC
MAVAAVSIGAVAFAHTHVAETTPVDGEVLKSAPAEVSVRFGEPDIPAQPAQVSEASLEVLDACGIQVDNKDSNLTMEDSKVTVTSGGTTAGRYEIHWSATASDGAAQVGVLDFTVTEGTRCKSVTREDAKKDIDVGFDVVGLKSTRVKGGALLQLTTAAPVTCASLAANGESALGLKIDNNSDRIADLVGRFVCAGDETKLVVKTVDGQATGKLAASITGKGVSVKLTKHALVGHIDVYAESFTDSDAKCEDKVCLDTAPDLGLVSVF